MAYGDTRQPSRYEVRAMAYLALSYGVKGLIYSVYTDYYEGNYKNGVVSAINYKPIPKEIYNELGIINSEIKNMSPILLELNWTDNSVVATNLSTMINAETLVEKNNAKAYYLGLVNLNVTNNQTFKIIINKTLISPVRITGVRNILTDEYIFTTDNGDSAEFTLKLTPGEGKIFKIDTCSFVVKNNNGKNVACFDNTGNLFLKGNCTTSSNCVASSNSFIIANYTDNTVAYINTTGDLCLENGDCSDSSANCNPIRTAFIIQNLSNYNMSYIDFNGDLCLTGKLYRKSVV